ncbi:MAG TPA: amidohydrolase family protein [Verrucomicrobiales bacterium]|nr:amidohydrolase family protein [Verrucomicrobiales bacterium]
MKTAFLFLTLSTALHAQVAVKARLLYPMTGDLAPIKDAVVLCGPDGKIQRVGPAAEVPVPDGWKVLTAEVAMPGIVDARTTVGVSGILNWDRRDQEQFEASSPVQPELRAIDAYNGRDPLVQWVREFGVTTIHTGHAPGELVSGQTMILKTNVPSITKKEDTLSGFAGVSVTLGADGLNKDKKPPGTRAKSVAMLRAELIKAREYLAKQDKAEGDKKPDRDLHLESLGAVLKKEVPFIVTADRHQDITAALRLQTEFGFRLVLDSAAEAYLLLDTIKASGVPVIVHPVMARAAGDRENMTFTLPAKLQAAGIPFALQSGYETYVPKTRVVLFEAGMAAAHGLTPQQALAAITIHPAEILGLQTRLGSLAAGKDADVALYDGDPLETVTHCTGVIIGGKIVSEVKR